jgi:heat shock protein HslJ
MKKNKNRLVTISLSIILFQCSCGQLSISGSTQNPDPAHNSRLSLDWQGSYFGILPCANCEGIATTIHINEDETYEIQMIYLGKDDSSTFWHNGQFSWDETGNKITLEGIEDGNNHYQVAENQLIKLNNESSRIVGELADHYVLYKKALNDEEMKLHGIYWKLTKLGEKTADGNAEHFGRVYLKLDLYKMRAFGYNGCNNFFGSFEIPSSGKINFKPLASTKMACPDNEVETLLMFAFANIDAYTISEGGLTLSGGGKPLAVFKASKE